MCKFADQIRSNQPSAKLPLRDSGAFGTTDFAVVLPSNRRNLFWRFLAFATIALSLITACFVLIDYGGNTAEGLVVTMTLPPPSSTIVDVRTGDGSTALPEPDSYFFLKVRLHVFCFCLFMAVGPRAVTFKAGIHFQASSAGNSVFSIRGDGLTAVTGGLDVSGGPASFSGVQPAVSARVAAAKALAIEVLGPNSSGMFIMFISPPPLLLKILNRWKTLRSEFDRFFVLSLAQINRVTQRKLSIFDDGSLQGASAEFSEQSTK